MSGSIITTQAIIKARDETGQVFSEIGQKLLRLEKQLGQAGKATALKANLDAVAKKLAAIDKFRGVMPGVAAARVKFAEAKAAVEQLGRAMNAAAKPSKELQLAYERAQRKASAAASAFEKQTAALTAARAGLTEAGVSVRHLASEESHLKGAVEGVNTALTRQIELSRAAASGQERLAPLRHAFRDTAGHLLLGGAGIGAGYMMARGIKHAVKSAADEQLAYVYAQLAAGRDPDSAAGRNDMGRLRATAEGASIGTVFSRAEVAKMMPAIAGMADVPLHAALPFMPGAIQFAELTRQFGAAMGKSFEAQESAAAAIRLAHQMGITDPRQMLPVLNAMVPAVTTAAESPNDLVKVLQYMMGSAAGVGMSNREALNLGTLGSILVPGSRAGTSLNMLLTGLMPKAGPGAGTKIARKAALRRADLVHMGLIDPRTGQLFRDEQGGMLVPLLQHLHSYYEAHKANPSAVYGEFVKLFEQRGARIAFELARNPKMVSMAREIDERQRSFEQMGGVAGVQAKQNETLSGQARRARANIETLGTDLANTTTGPLSGLLEHANRSMEAARGFIDRHPAVAQGVVGTGGAAALGGAGYLTYQWLTAAGALKSSAANLTAAAEALKLSAGGKGVPGMPGAPGRKAPGIGAARLGLTALNFGLAAWNTVDEARKHPELLNLNSAANRQRRAAENAWLGDTIPGLRWFDRKSDEAHNWLFGAPTRQAPPPHRISPHFATGLAMPAGAAGDVGGKIRAALADLRATVVQPVPVDVSGKLDPVELKGEAQVRVTVAVKGNGEVTDRFVSSSGHIRASLGTSMPSLEPGHPPPT